MVYTNNAKHVVKAFNTISAHFLSFSSLVGKITFVYYRCVIVYVSVYAHLWNVWNIFHIYILDLGIRRWWVKDIPDKSKAYVKKLEAGNYIREKSACLVSGA